MRVEGRSGIYHCRAMTRSPDYLPDAQAHVRTHWRCLGVSAALALASSNYFTSLSEHSRSDAPPGRHPQRHGVRIVENVQVIDSVGESRRVGP